MANGGIDSPLGHKYSHIDMSNSTNNVGGRENVKDLVSRSRSNAPRNGKMPLFGLRDKFTTSESA